MRLAAIHSKESTGTTNAPRRRTGSSTLVIMKAIVEQHGLSLLVTSTPGAGSVFTIVIPDAIILRDAGHK